MSSREECDALVRVGDLPLQAEARAINQPGGGENRARSPSPTNRIGRELLNDAAGIILTSGFLTAASGIFDDAVGSGADLLGGTRDALLLALGQNVLQPLIETTVPELFDLLVDGEGAEIGPEWPGIIEQRLLDLLAEREERDQLTDEQNAVLVAVYTEFLEALIGQFVPNGGPSAATSPVTVIIINEADGTVSMMPGND